MKTYTVTVVRTSYAKREVTVQAENEADAKAIAIEQSIGEEFDEQYDSEFSADID